MALPVHKVPGLQGHMAVFLQKRRVVPAGDKADVLAVGLAGVQQPRLAGAFPDGGLVIVPHRQQQVGQLALGQLIEHIALVLPPVPAPQQAIQPRDRVPVHPGIVAGGDVVIPQHQSPVQQRAELQAAVAVDAGVGGMSGAVFRHEPVHDLPGEALRLVEHIKLHAQAIGHRPGVVSVVGGAAGPRLFAVIQPQHGPVALVPLLPQQQGGGAAVHAAGHGHQYAFSFHV